MAKTAKNGGKAGNENKKESFEERLERLEELGERIRETGIPLEKALEAFEEGVALAKTLEKELDKIESRVEILKNSSDAKTSEVPELDLFDGDDGDQ
jgi:exodeoxyribonuclease VII small subunit